jgi:hypothetical protein
LRITGVFYVFSLAAFANVTVATPRASIATSIPGSLLMLSS